MSKKIKKVFVVALNSEALKPALAALQKYNFEITFFDGISDAVLSMSQTQPVCILVSSECAAKDLFSLEVLNLQNKVPLIGYTEKSLVSSVVQMKIYKFQYKIQPPVTGAAIYRTIQKVIADNRLSVA